MIIIMKPQATEEQIGTLCDSLGKQGMQVQRNAGVDCTVLGVLGDVAKLDPHDFLIQPGVERVMPVSEPFKKANRKFHPTDSVIDCGGVKVGGRRLIEKTVQPDAQGVTRVPFMAEDTAKLKPRGYVWDIRFALEAAEDESGDVTAYREMITPMEPGILWVLPAIGESR